jgi:uncharacterized protein YggE
MTIRSLASRIAGGLTAACAVSALLPAFAQGGPDFQNQAFTTPYWTRVPVIEALGRSEMQVAPNRASFSVTYLETDKDSKDAMKLAVERGRLAYDTIKNAAGKDSIIQSSVSVTALYEQYRDKDGNRIDNERSDKIRAYEARVSLSVVVEDVSKAGKARAGALALGPENSSGLSTYLERTTELNREAYESAVKDGAARAAATAKASGGRLGKLMVVQEGSGANLPGLPAPTGWSQEAALLLTLRHASMASHAGQWALPGGRIDDGETPEQAALITAKAQKAKTNFPKRKYALKA